MPELPEVETIRRDLFRLLIHRRIVRCFFRYAKIVHPSIAMVRKNLMGNYIKKISRRGKMLICHLSSGHYLFIHLKMTGQIVWQPDKGKVLAGGHPITGVTTVPNKFTHIILTFKDKSKLYFNDVRRFGYWKLVDKASATKIINSFGPEPLSAQFNHLSFKRKLTTHKRVSIKANLLNQTVVAGIGNIYADESLWYAKIKPNRLTQTLTDGEILSLCRAIKKVIKLAIHLRGTSFSNYVDALGRVGKYWNKRVVYGRAGLPCYTCGSLIRKVRLAGRGTHYCVNCQL